MASAAVLPDAGGAAPGAAALPMANVRAQTVAAHPRRARVKVMLDTHGIMPSCRRRARAHERARDRPAPVRGGVACDLECRPALECRPTLVRHRNELCVDPRCHPTGGDAARA